MTEQSLSGPGRCRSTIRRRTAPVRRPTQALAVSLVVALLAGCTGDDSSDGAGAGEETATSVERAASSDAAGDETDQTDEVERSGAGGGQADGAGRDGWLATIPEIVAEVQPTVVAVQHAAGEGSGVIVDPSGLVVTNDHVVNTATSALRVVLATGEQLAATIVGTDPFTDLALLRVRADGELPAATLADELPVVGELAVAMGNPLGFENTATAGIISGLQRSIPGPIEQTRALVDLIQTDAAISPGNSGGALVNADAEVIGINVAYLPPGIGAVSLGFAIPAPTVRDVVEELTATGQVRHAYLGVRPASLTPQIAERFGLAVDSGVLVLDVVPGGPAAAAGLVPGDVIVELDGEAIDALGPFLARLRDASPGDTVDLAVVRDGETLTLSAQLGQAR